MDLALASSLFMVLKVSPPMYSLLSGLLYPIELLSRICFFLSLIKLISTMKGE